MNGLEEGLTMNLFGRIVNFGAWPLLAFVSIYYGYYGLFFVGPFFITIYLAGHLFEQYLSDFQRFCQDLLLVIFSLVIGIISETIYAAVAFYYQPVHSFVPAIWIIFIYPLFAVTLNHSLTFLRDRKFVALLLALMIMPLYYFFAVRQNIIDQIAPSWLALIVLLGCSAAFFLVLTAFNRMIHRLIVKTFDPEKNRAVITVLFDGDCPICSSEIRHLRKRNLYGSIRFVDIASADFDPKKHQNVSYRQAMREMHIIDSHGHILTGIDAFIKIYARSGHVIIAVLMQIPVLQLAFRALYKIFAKSRLWIPGRKS
jgi:predicted DCC family thiol-disulfide oxidoreductase YuxK